MLEPRRRRSRAVRALAASVAVSLGVGIALMDSAAPAAADTPRAQAVGRFLDGAAGGTPLQSVVDLKDARATNPGTVSDQNPFDVVVGGQGDIPLSHKLQLPGSGNAFHVGAANQVAEARSNGYSLGAAGRGRETRAASRPAARAARRRMRRWTCRVPRSRRPCPFPVPEALLRSVGSPRRSAQSRPARTPRRASVSPETPATTSAA